MDQENILTLEEQIKDRVQKFKSVLLGTPMIYQQNPEISDVVTLIFGSNEKRKLNCAGIGKMHGAYPTAEQINIFIQQKGEDPTTVRYQYQDSRVESPLIIESPYDCVKTIIEKKGKLGLSCKLTESNVINVTLKNYRL